jgi:5-methylcytosine-specific restriction endonuclease McrA
MRTPTKSSLKNKLDKEISRIVRARGACEFCGNQDYSKFQAAHIFSRSNFSLRWRLDNLLCLCASCHFWSHRNPLFFAEKVRVHLGELKYHELKKDSLIITKYSLEEMKLLLDALRKVE